MGTGSYHRGEGVNELLWSTFDKVTDCQRFAETKASALVVLNSGVLLFVGQLGNGEWTQSRIGLASVIVLSLGHLVSLLLCLYSFVPQTTESRFDQNRPGEQDNLLFFGDIAKYEPQTYLQSLLERPEPYSAEERFLARQIITNSKITLRKFILFRWAIELTFYLSFVAAALFVLFFLMNGGV